MFTNEEEMKQISASIGNIVRKALPKDVGFTLLIFGYTPNNFLTYISSAQRKDMISVLKETIIELEKSK